jgi:hypothetical protein
MRWAAYCAFLLVAAPTVYHVLSGSSGYLGFFEDDYFYYAVIADNLATSGRLTFDGLTVTNGFHPLWFLVVAGLRHVSGAFGPVFYVLLTLVMLASMVLTYELSRTFALRMSGSPVAASVSAGAYAVATAELMTSGMECVLAVPLFLWLLVEVARDAPVTPRRSAALGFIASLAVLARLDLGIAVVLLVIGYTVLARPAVSRLARLMAAFSLGGVLVPIYCLANWIVFGSPLPVSGLAKHIQTGVGFSVTYAERVALGTMYGPTIALVLPLGLFALFVLVRRRPTARLPARFAGGIALVFAFLFFGLNALTGWTFFGWYAYPIAPAVVAALIFGIEWSRPMVTSRAVRMAVAAAVILLVPLSGLRYFVERGPRWSVADNPLLAMSYELSHRMRDRGGLIAMGAVAGFATYVMHRPVFQLEGIVADLRLVDHLKRRTPLGDVLREYGADYLVVTLAGVPMVQRDGCYVVTQPHPQWAGERAAKMAGLLCGEPADHFTTPSGGQPWSKFGRLETFVWDLRRVSWRPLAAYPAAAGD